MMQVFDKRPPFVWFEEQEYGRDVEASEKAGRPIPRVVVMACITPAMSKDEVVKVATEWLDKIKQEAIEGRYPPDWAQRFRMQYEEWLKGNELPREGTPIKTWPMLSREQSRRILAFGITTVEDLAEVPDGDVTKLGLDGRYLRDTARGWLTEAKDKGALAKALADANVQIEDLRQSNADLRQRLAALEQAGERRGPGRPRKDEAA